MSQTVPATFVTAANKAGSVRITFEIDDAVRDTVAELINSKMGKQYLLVAFEIGAEAEDIQSAFSDKNFTKKQLLKQVHAIIGDYSLSSGVAESKIKQLLKLILQRKGALSSNSLSELDEQGLSVAVYTLRTNMHPNSFNYAEYVLTDGK